MLNNKTLLFFAFFFLPAIAFSQNCNVNVSGYIWDASTGEPISDAHIYLKEARKGAVSDSAGFFRLSSVCPRNYHLSVSHIGCKTRELYMTMEADTTLHIVLDHDSRLLDQVTFISPGGKTTTAEKQSLNEKNIAENANENLANMLSSISGVRVIRNGNNISTPVVHGLYGNRLTILNNGVTQSGQQWGTDHSPEIDPWAASRITVIKGVGALEYQGNSLGSIILVEPRKIEKEPHMHGKGSYFFETNGNGHGLNGQLQQHYEKPALGWRAVGTLKKSGDNETPDYYLRNTGREEANIAVQLEKAFSERWTTDLYFSSYNTNIGVLRGSHIGNLTDLEEALTREVPFFTEEDFSYNIEAPYQKVNHHLIKFHSNYFITDNLWFDLTYSGQLNYRKEFDVRRSGRTEDPSLSLRQFSHFAEGRINRQFSKGWKVKSGFQFNRVDNINLPETGVLPLIPDYISYESGIFVLASKTKEKALFEFGGRYDYEDRRIAAISSSVPREIIRYDNSFHNLGAAGGFNYELIKSLSIAYNLGYASRNPEVNELYSNGLHQGVSGIEEGDPLLKQEQSIKNTFSLKGNIKNKLFFESMVYLQQINDYIFLNPTNEVRLTIRGAFPVFEYEQTDARLFGVDAAATYKILDHFNTVIKYSFIRGQDISNNLPLIYMPSNTIYAELNYQLPKIGKFENLELQVNNRYVFEQTYLLPNQDFTAPPPGYNLAGLKASAEKQSAKMRHNFFIKMDNLFNVAYRDYLNRQRYFADDLGFNLIIGVSSSF
ncbi:MAG: TonB-dependent receptor [Bacteroidia bacterium]